MEASSLISGLSARLSGVSPLPEPDTPEWLQALARVPATDRWSTITVYAITNLTAAQAGPDELTDWLRGPWAIEVLHHIRDTARTPAGYEPATHPECWPPCSAWTAAPRTVMEVEGFISGGNGREWWTL